MRFRASTFTAVAVGALTCALAAPAQGQASPPEGTVAPVQSEQSSAQVAQAQVKASEDPTGRPAPQQAEEGVVKDIIVTAQRREESLQNVPIAITALSSAKLADANINNFTQLQEVTPGLVSQGSNGNATPFIRGIGALGTNPGNDAPVATYVDGIYISSKKSNLFSVSESIDRIEVLRGPQGTLFGRNSTGGAIQIITKDPDYKFRGSGQVEYGSFNRVGGQGYVTGGISDTLSANLAVAYIQNDGYVKNLDPAVNGGGKTVGDSREFNIRGKIRWQPTSNFQLILTGDHAYAAHNAAVAQSTVSSLTALVATPGVPSFTPTTVPRTYNGSNIPLSDDRNNGVSLRMLWSTPLAEITSLTSYRYDKARNAIDLDLVPANIFTFQDFQVTKTFEQELRFSSPSKGPLKWQFGAFYLHDKAGFEPLRELIGTPVDVTPSQLASISAADPTAARIFVYSHQIVDSIAGFGEVGYDITPSTTVTGGLRYTNDHVELAGDGRETIQLPNSSQTDFTETTLLSLPHSYSKTFGELTYRINLQQRFGPNAMVYGSFNRGYKSGIYNISDLANTTPTEPEIVKAYELGSKLDLLNRHVRLNVSAFYNDYSNLQVQVTDASAGGIQRTENAARARIKGVEAEGTFVVDRNLSFDANVSFLDAKYRQYNNASIYVVGPTGRLALTTRNLQNSVTPYSPKFTFTVSGQYIVRFANESHLDLSANFYHNSGYCIETACLAQIRQNAFNMIGVSATWFSPDNHYFVRAFGRNLANENVFSGNTVTNFGAGLTYEAPATWGIAAGFKF